MKARLNKIIDRASEFLAYRKGFLPFVGIILVLINWVLQFIPGLHWLSNSNALLHFGVIVAILGLLLTWAL